MSSCEKQIIYRQMEQLIEMWLLTVILVQVKSIINQTIYNNKILDEMHTYALRTIFHECQQLTNGRTTSTRNDIQRSPTNWTTSQSHT